MSEHTHAVDVRVCVVCYRSFDNAPEEMRQFVSLASTADGLGWYFVDNSPGSVDAAVLRSALEGASNVTVVSRPDNPGFAAAVDLAIDDAPPRWILLLNPDLLVRDGQLADILDGLGAVPDEVGSVAIGQSTQGFVHRGITLGPFGWFADRAVPGERGSVGRRLLGTGALVGPSGGAAVYRVQALRDVGGFDPDLFAWGEDVDVALRLKSAGWGVVEHDAVLQHRGGHSVTDAPTRRVRAYNLARNRWVIAGRHYSRSQVLRMAAFQFAFAPVLAVRACKGRVVSAQCRGTWDGLRAFRRERRARLRLGRSERGRG